MMQDGGTAMLRLVSRLVPQVEMMRARVELLMVEVFVVGNGGF